MTIADPDHLPAPDEQCIVRIGPASPPATASASATPSPAWTRAACTWSPPPSARRRTAPAAISKPSDLNGGAAKV